MSRSGFSDDATALLYIAPFLLSGVYGLYLWVLSGPSLLLPTTVFLAVTRDPYVFILGSLAVILALMLDVNSADTAERPARLKHAAESLQYVAVASLILAIIFAWYSNGFLDLSGTVDDFLVGRFGTVFPALMVLFSYMLTIPVRTQALSNSRFLGIVLLLLVPAVVYEVGKRSQPIGLAGSVVLLLAGLALLLRSPAGTKAPESGST